jgi:hypothetical protein
MNETVTATGMEIKAQASGSLVIGSNPLQSSTGAPNVNINTGLKQLTPICLEEVTADDTTTGVWKKPISTTTTPSSTTPSVIHPTLGTPDYRGTASVSDSEAQASYVEQVIYVGTSGETALTGGTITVSLGSTASSADTLATKAYSVAVYFAGVVNATYDGTNGWSNIGSLPAVTADPDMILHVDNADGRNTLTIPFTGTIPSVLGYGEGNNNGTGLKVVLRFYVDGGLTTVTETKPVDIGYAYTNVAGTTYNADTTYWIAGDYVEVTEAEKCEAAAGMIPNGWYVAGSVAGSYEAATPKTAIDKTKTYYKLSFREATAADVNGQTTVPANWYTRSDASETAPYKYHYVNNNTIPSVGTRLSVSFTHTPASN